MQYLIEILSEKVQRAIDNKDGNYAEKIIADCEEWYENYIRELSNPLDDPIFYAVYTDGYDNISWEEIQMTLENAFQDDIYELIFMKSLVKCFFRKRWRFYDFRNYYLDIVSNIVFLPLL
jgi:hypothetical protein